MDALLRASRSASRDTSANPSRNNSRPATGQGPSCRSSATGSAASSRPNTRGSRVSFADDERPDTRGSRASTADSRPSTAASDASDEPRRRSRRSRRSRADSDDLSEQESLLNEQGVHVRAKGFGGRKKGRKGRKSKAAPPDDAASDAASDVSFGALARLGKLAKRPNTTGERRRPRTPPSDDGVSSYGKKRPMTPVFDDGFMRARAILRKRYEDRPHLRPPGSRPAARGIGLDMASIGTMSVAYINQYVEASVNILREHNARAKFAMQEGVERTQGISDVPLDRTGQPMDVFERAELPENRRLPLCSQLARGRAPDPVPKGATSPSKKSGGAHAMLRDRLFTLARLARDDICLVGVRFTHENLDDDWGASTAQALRRNTQLSSLVLVGNGITDASATKLAAAVCVHPALTTVAIGGNALGDETALGFARALKESGTLVQLNLASKKFHHAHYLDVAQRRRPPKEIIVEPIDGDYFDARDWGKPSDDPEFNPRSNYIGPQGCFALAEALHGTQLTALNLIGQRIGNEGALALSRALFASKDCPCSCLLTQLALDSNHIGDAGASALIQCWANKDSSLASLRLAMNPLTDETAVQAASLALKHYGVEELLKKKKKKKRIGSLSPRARRRRDVKEGVVVKEDEPEEELKDLELLDLALCQIGEIGVLAVQAAGERCLKIQRLIPLHGNPGHDANPTQFLTAPQVDLLQALERSRGELSLVEYKTQRRCILTMEPSKRDDATEDSEYLAQLERGRSMRPVQFGGSSRADSGAPLMTLKTAIPFMAPNERKDLSPRSALDASQGTESVLRRVARKAIEREERRVEGALPESRRMKQHRISETGKPRFEADPSLPPLSFLNHHKSHIRRLGAERRRVKKEEVLRLEQQAKRETLARNVTSKRLQKAILDAGTKQVQAETATGALRARAIGDVVRAFPVVAALPGAASGRLDLGRHGPRFGHRPVDPSADGKWAAKVAAKKKARHAAFLVHLGRAPIH